MFLIAIMSAMKTPDQLPIITVTKCTIRVNLQGFRSIFRYKLCLLHARYERFRAVLRQVHRSPSGDTSQASVTGLEAL